MKKAAATKDPQKLQPWKKRTSKYFRRSRSIILLRKIGVLGDRIGIIRILCFFYWRFLTQSIGHEWSTSILTDSTRKIKAYAVRFKRNDTLLLRCWNYRLLMGETEGNRDFWIGAAGPCANRASTLFSRAEQSRAMALLCREEQFWEYREAKLISLLKLKKNLQTWTSVGSLTV